MFLKRIVMHGFKSFADRTVIEFNDPITGIVGPNGCGKSNITDAIRWVLGEQSAKSLRGSAMSDVIFAGSSTRKPLNTAEVTLVFDNHDHRLPSTYEELEITRRVHRGDGANEYLINNQPARLRDIQDLTMDSGLGRESLGIITQGNVQAFAEAKPEDRRAFFEDAAGVSKYKKRRHESAMSLERTNANLERLKDIVGEIQKQVEPLRKQAAKAKKYAAMKEELESIEVGVLVSEIRQLDQVINESGQKLIEKEAERLINDTQISNLENENNELRNSSHRLDFEIGGLQEQLIRVNNQIQELERRKVEIDEKRKYQIDNADDKEKIRQLKELMQEAQFNYEDLRSRYAKMQTEMDLAKSAQEQLSGSLTEATQDLNGYREGLQRLVNRSLVVKDQMQSPFQYQQGVQSIVQAKAGLPGILDVFAQAVKPKDQFETAVSTAAGGAMYHIITKDEASARGAITFLKRNHSGRATFLPLDVISPRYINKETRVIAENMQGYLGVASDFTEYDPKYENVVLNILGSTLVTDTLETANELARRLRYTCRIVTLEGDLVNPGGSMTGGFQKNNYSPMTLRTEYDRLQSQISQMRVTEGQKREKVNELSNKLSDAGDEILSRRIEMAKLETSMNNARNVYENAKLDYEEADPEGKDAEDGEAGFNQLLSDLNNAYSRRSEIMTSIRLKNEKRTRNSSDTQKREEQIRKIRRAIAASEADVKEITAAKIKAETMKQTYLTRLNTEYQMTLEHASTLEFDMDLEAAKERVLVLQRDMKALGSINPDAPAQFEEINARYTEYKKQYDELVSASDKLRSTIKELDEIMNSKFSDTFKKVNAELPEVFVKLFGGGRAKLILSEPGDLLNTGVDIDVQPPGKNVQNIRLFSGGEKSLIAIAVLFSILKVRPVPLCLFDEIESALDARNVERFAKYCRDFSSDTQFLIVSHRTGTMEQCNVLYGVTMPQQGVSQMLKVRLSEAREMAEEPQEV